MEHECLQNETIKQLQIDLAVAKSDIKTVKDDIKDISMEIRTSKNWTIATLVTVLISVIGAVFMLMTK